MTKLLGLLAAASLAVTPALASAAPVANPAQALSVAGARAGSVQAHGSKLAGVSGIGALLGGVIVAGIAAILIIDGTGKNDSPDSP